jgi:hypothetical protein
VAPASAKMLTRSSFLFKRMCLMPEAGEPECSRDLRKFCNGLADAAI